MELTEDGIVKSINVPYSKSNETKKMLLPVTPATVKANPRDFLTEEILMASSTAKMAELVAKEIYNIRESKKCPFTRPSGQHSFGRRPTQNHARQSERTGRRHDQDVLGHT